MAGNILIGLDRSEHITLITELGIRWAQRTGATLVGLGIVDEPGIRSIEPAWAVGGKSNNDPVYYMGYEPRMADVHRQVQEYLDRFATLCDEAGVSHEERKRVGSPYDLIAIESQSCDLVVLAQRFHFRFTTRDEEGSGVLRTVMQDSPRPIVLVPDTTLSDGPVAIAYDGSLQSARALSAFQASGLGTSVQVHIVSISSRAAEAAEHAERAVRFLKSHSTSAVADVIESSSSPAKEILEQVKKHGIALLVMGAYGQPTLREFLVGSVTRTILEQSPVPVFLYY